MVRSANKSGSEKNPETSAFCYVSSENGGLLDYKTKPRDAASGVLFTSLLFHLEFWVDPLQQFGSEDTRQFSCDDSKKIKTI